jgi:SAM-dependent methyltransferase
MSVALPHPEGRVLVDDLPGGRRRIHVSLNDPTKYLAVATVDTAYPLDLIDALLRCKGPAWLGDEICRDEQPEYVQHSLRCGMLTYVEEEAFQNARILDFGCGSGASTVNLKRLFPQSEVVGVEIDPDLLAIARARKDFYGLVNVQFLQSPAPDRLPADIGEFQYVLLCGVYEHLLPPERRTLLSLMWSAMRPGAVLFMNQTPNRYSLRETHTTGGVWLLNYLPPTPAMWWARQCSRKIPRDATWPQLLRKGIRGGSVGEIVSILRREPGDRPEVLVPRLLGCTSRADIWCRETTLMSGSTSKNLMRSVLRLLGPLGTATLPYLAIAVRKPTGQPRC